MVNPAMSGNGAALLVLTVTCGLQGRLQALTTISAALRRHRISAATAAEPAARSVIQALDELQTVYQDVARFGRVDDRVSRNWTHAIGQVAGLLAIVAAERRYAKAIGKLGHDLGLAPDDGIDELRQLVAEAHDLLGKRRVHSQPARAALRLVSSAASPE